MKKKLLLGLIAFSIFATGEISATTYRLFVHGRSSTNHCSPISNVNSATTDVGNYWGGTVTGLSNVRYIGYDGTQNGGAYSWNSCGAQSQLYNGVRVFCTGGNNCQIYTHSTGGLVAAAFFSQQNISGLNISRIQLLASAAGGSELADLSTSYLSWLGVPTLGGQLDQSVSVSGARNGFDHNQSHGRLFYTTSGEGSDYFDITSPFLPGYDDGVLANHSLCSINKAEEVEVGCARGNGTLVESYRCGFLWLSTCYKHHYRWSPYYTVWEGGSSESHSDAKRDYNRR